MTDIADMIRSDLSRREVSEQSRREQNRARMPGVAAIVDEFESVFGKGQVKVRWASENGVEVGVRRD